MKRQLNGLLNHQSELSRILRRTKSLTQQRTGSLPLGFPTTFPRMAALMQSFLQDPLQLLVNHPRTGLVLIQPSTPFLSDVCLLLEKRLVDACSRAPGRVISRTDLLGLLRLLQLLHSLQYRKYRRSLRMSPKYVSFPLVESSLADDRMSTP